MLKSVISVVLSLSFCFTGAYPPNTVEVTGHKLNTNTIGTSSENLSASSRFQPPVLIEWDDEARTYKFYDHTDSFVKEFRQRSGMAYLTALFGQVLKNQQDLASKDLNMSEEGLIKRFEVFSDLLFKEKKDQLLINVPEFDFSSSEEFQQIRLENNRTIWLSGINSDSGDIYFYCFYLRNTEEKEQHLYSLPVGDNKIVVCRRLGPFKKSYIGYDYTAAQIKADILFSLFRSSILELGSEADLTWNKYANSRVVIDFYTFLRNDTEGFSDLVKRDYFSLMLVNILVSTNRIIIPEIKRPLVDYFLLKDEKKKKDSMKAFREAWRVEALKEKEGEIPDYRDGMRVFQRILRSIKNDFREEGLDTIWIKEFQKDIAELIAPVKMEPGSRPETIKDKKKKQSPESFKKEILRDAKKKCEEIAGIIDDLEYASTEDLEFLAGKEHNLNDLLTLCLSEEQPETAEKITNVYFKKIWTSKRRAKTKNFLPGDGITEAAMLITLKTGNYDNLPLFIDILFSSIKDLFIEVPALNSDIIAALYSIEDSISKVIAALVDVGRIEMVNEIIDKYLFELWTSSRRERAKDFLPGYGISRLIAAVKFSQNHYAQSRAILEHAIAAFDKNRKFFSDEAANDFRTNALLQLGESCLRQGEIKEALKKFDKLQEQLEPIIEDKTVIRKRKYLVAYMSLLANLRDISLIENDSLEALDICNRMDPLIAGGNESLSTEDKDKIVSECISRIDLGLRLWAMTENQEKLEKVINKYRDRILELNPEIHQLKLYDGWIAFKKGRMDVVRDKIETLSREGRFEGKEYVVFLQLCKIAARYYHDKSEQATADRLAEIGLKIIGDPPDNYFDRCMYNDLMAAKKGYGYMCKKIGRDLAEGKYVIDDIAGILSLIFMNSAVYEHSGGIPDIYTADGKARDIYELLLKVLTAEYKNIAYEYFWTLPERRGIFLRMMKKLFTEGKELLSLRKKTNLLYFLAYVEEDDIENKWLVERLYDLENEVNKFAVKDPGNRERNQNIESYLDAIDSLLTRLKSAFSSGERLEEAKKFLSAGQYGKAMEEAKKGIELMESNGDDDEETEISLYMAKTVAENILEAEICYSGQRFTDAKNKYDASIDDLKALAVPPPQALKNHIGKTGKMAEAEETYRLSKDDEAVKIASRVKDSVSGEFIQKVKSVKNISLRSEKGQKAVETLLSRYPHDGRLRYLHGELLRIRKQQKDRLDEQKRMLSEARNILKRGEGNNIDELINTLEKLIEFEGMTKSIRGFIAFAVQSYGKDKKNIEALKLLEAVREFEGVTAEKYGMKLAALRDKYEETVKKENYRKKEKYAEKIFDKARAWFDSDAELKTFKSIMKDLEAVYQRKIMREEARKHYIAMLEDAYDKAYYGPVIVHARKAMKLFGPGEKGKLNLLVWKAEAKQLIAKLRRHYNIIDCELQGEIFSIRNRRYNWKEEEGKPLQFYFEKAEYSQNKLRISDIFAYDSIKKTKADIKVLDSILSNETYRLFSETENGEKIEIDISVANRNSDYIEFNFSYPEEKNKLKQEQGLKAGYLVLIKDPSLLRRRNKLRGYICVLENCIHSRKPPATGHQLHDIALEVSQDKVRNPDPIAVRFKDTKLSGDKGQKAAVEACLNPALPFHLIQGPPGTGKTRLTIELIRQFYEKNKKVLVVSQSNAGIDNLGKKLLALQENGDRIKFARVGNKELSIDEKLRENWRDRKDILSEMYQKASGGSVVLGTTNGFPSLMSIMTNKKMAGYYSSFDVVIVEEAGRATLAETIYPISWVREDGKVILVGDHNQLPAYGIDSQKQRETIRELVNNGYDEARLKQYFSYKNINEYKESLFQALYEKSKYFIKAVNKHFLCINRRSHWAIARMISDVFYESRIVPDPDRVDERLERDTINVIDYDKGTDRKDNEKTSGTSIVNRAEARIVLDEVDRFLSQGKDGNYRYSAGDITIITPYEAQTKKIERMLEIKAVLNAIRTREIFSMPAEERYARFELLEYFLGTDPAFSQEVMTALGRVKKAKNKTKEKDIKTVLESESFLFFNNKHSERDFTFEDLKRIKIENVDSIQGSENKVVILSLVRSNTSGDIGFLGTKDGLQRLNVAFSRAREKFTVVGDFANTLCIADPRKNGKYNKDTERTVEAFRKVLEVYQELYDDKNMGGSEAWNEAVINAVIRKHIEKGAVVKISFKRGFFCYKPRVIDVSLPGYGNVEKTVSPVLTREEEKRLLKYIINSLNSVEAPAAQLGLTDIRVGIIKETAYVNPPGDGTFSIVHTGARTATIWFGELFLKDILAEEKDEDTQALMDHEIRHILDPFGAVMDHRQSWYEDLKYRMQTRAEKVRGQKETRRMLDNIAQYAHKAGDNKKLFIGLDTSWFSNAGELKVLMSYISKLSGKDNIVIKTGKGPGLASLIEEEIKDRDFSNVVVLGSEKTINNPAFNVMKNVSYGKRAFFAKIDPRQLRPALSPGEYYYIRVIEMINIALTLAFGERVSLKNIQQSYPGVRIRSTRDPKIYYFIPTAEPVELKELNELYKAQTRVIFSA